jgi:hypothetical protein
VSESETGRGREAVSAARTARAIAGATTHTSVANAANAAGLVATADESLLDVIDNLLNRGVLLQGELVLGLADVDLVYARLSLLLCAADRVLPPR